MKLIKWLKAIHKKINCPCENGTWKVTKTVRSNQGVEHFVKWLICDACGSKIRGETVYNPSYRTLEEWGIKDGI